MLEITTVPTESTDSLEHHQQGYYRAPRTEIVTLVPATAHRILDLGCGDGAVGAQLKAANAARYIVGVEMNADAALRARVYIDKVYECDVEELSPSEPIGSFDCLIYGDILEHLIDPAKALRNHYPLLRASGCVIVSVPNVQFYYVIWSLLRGRWTYTDRGIFDRGHLRFFTLYEIKRLLASAGYQVTAMRRNYRLFERPSRGNRFAKGVAWLPLLRPFLTYQYVLLARKQARTGSED